MNNRYRWISYGLGLFPFFSLAQTPQVDMAYPEARFKLKGERFFEPKVKNFPRKSKQEWQLLPKQSWEEFSFQLEPEIDPLGFDRRSKIIKPFQEKITMTQTISTDRLAFLGEVVSARTDFEQVFIGEQVFIQADDDLQMGAIYSITEDAQEVISTRDRRMGYGYNLVGSVKIIGVRDGLFIATVVDLKKALKRGQFLIPEIRSVHSPKIIKAPSPVLATTVIPKGSDIENYSSRQLIFADVGTQDGIQPGMIFRHYMRNDPVTGDPITSRDFLIESELVVIQSDENFSTLMVLGSRGNLRANEEIVALTDLTDFEKHRGIQTVIQDEVTQKLDDLDAMDSNVGVGASENEELKDLETWVKTPSEIEIGKEARKDLGQVEGEIGFEKAPDDRKIKQKKAESSIPTPEIPAENTQSDQELDQPTPSNQDQDQDLDSSIVAPPSSEPTSKEVGTPIDAPPLETEPSASSPEVEIKGSENQKKSSTPDSPPDEDPESDL